MYVPKCVCNAPMATWASSFRWSKQLAAVSRPYLVQRGSNGAWLASNPLVPCFRISPVGRRWPIMASVGGLFQRQAWQAAERRVSLRFVACIQKRRRSDPLPSDYTSVSPYLTSCLLYHHPFSPHHAGPSHNCHGGAASSPARHPQRTFVQHTYA